MKPMQKEIEAYFNQFDAEIQKRLTEIRAIMFDEVPEGDEGIRYQMPTILYHGNLIHYAGFKKHIGVYPLPQVLEKMRDEIKNYKSGKGSIQFPNDEPLPAALIRKIVRARKEEKDSELAQKKKKA